MDLCLTNIQFFTAQDVKLMDWSHVDYCDCFYQLFETRGCTILDLADIRYANTLKLILADTSPLFGNNTKSLLCGNYKLFFLFWLVFNKNLLLEFNNK